MVSNNNFPHPNICERIKNIQQRINDAAYECHRTPQSIALLAVSKGHSYLDIEQAYAAGLHDFGENYLQEALPKIKMLEALPITWHFIGPIQSNKTKGIAHHFSWVHSVSRSTIAERLNAERALTRPPLNICLQVNLDDEDNKAGATPNELPGLITTVLQLPQLRLRGLMIIPKLNHDPEEQYLSFLRVTHLLQALNHTHNMTMDTLSMGMSDSLKPAIRAGSTIVRIGTALFGARQVTS